MAQIVYNKEYQQLFINLMLTDPLLFVRAAPILDVQYFDTSYQPVIEFFHEHSKEYNTLPTVEQIKARTGQKFGKLEELNFNQSQSALDEIEAFCKKRAVEIAVLECAERINDGKAEGIEKIVKDAVLLSLQRDLGTDYFADPRERMERLKSEQGELSTGWETVDKVLFGGFGWGELNIFVAPTGGGKSVALQNIALNMAEKGLNVIYITLELKEELVGKRLDGQLTGIPLKDLNKKLDDVELQVVSKGKSRKMGNIQLKYMRPQSTPNDIEAYLQEYEIQNETIPNIILVDYLDLLRPTDKSVGAGDFFMKDKLVSEELRAIAADRTNQGKKTTICSASQVNRSGLDETEFSLSGVAGGLSKAYTADNMITVFASTHMRERGEMLFQFLKTRNSAGAGKKLLMDYNIDTLKITDSEEEQNGYLGTPQASKLDQIRKKNKVEDDDVPVMDNTDAGRDTKEDFKSRGASLLDRVKKMQT